jgi:RimJ/RimL family protein N-acetyltransferase
MRMQRWDPADEATARACYDVEVAAHQTDEPAMPPNSYDQFALHLRTGWDYEPSEVWVATADDGTVAGFYRMTLPDLENLDKAYGGPIVHPAYRRRGLGREILRHQGTRAEANGRTTFCAEVASEGAGDAFAQAVGAKLQLEEVRRIQYLRDIAPGTVAALRAEAERAAGGYSLISWHGFVPDQYCAAMAEVYNAFADAPHGDNQEPERWDAERVRTRTGLAVRAGVMRSHSVAAVRDSDGEMAGYSEVIIAPEHPDWGYQQLTAVTRPHRGHRLGLLVKTAMLDLLAEAEPGLERILTGNAADNQHMISVNEQLGYQVSKPGWRFYEMPVSALR